MMKNIYFSLLLSLFIFSSAQAQPGCWIPLNSETSNSLLGICAPASKVCYVSGVNGVILKTIDAGYSWQSQFSGTSEDLYSCWFHDELRGYAVGNNGAAVRTTDGGATWIPMPVGTPAFLRSVKFIDDSTGYITGGFWGSTGVILKSTDGGISWSHLPLSTPKGMYCTWFTSPDTGYVTEYSGYVYKTTDAGASWTPAPAAFTNSGAPIWFTSESHGITAAAGGIISSSNDAGLTWTATAPGAGDHLSALGFYDSQHGFAVGGDVSANTGRILYTLDEGNTWHSWLPGTARLYNISFYDFTTGYICGLDGVILKYVYNPWFAGMEETNDNKIQIYPNPSSIAGFTISGLNKSTTEIIVSDQLSRIVYSEQISHSASVNITPRLAPGIYLISGRDEAGTTSLGKIIIQ
jgi:photosystem II stability/assembly factor-like uncharacterized protein